MAYVLSPEEFRNLDVRLGDAEAVHPDAEAEQEASRKRTVAASVIYVRAAFRRRSNA